MPDKIFHYVQNGFVHVWEKLGWVKQPALDGTHHGEFSALMEWRGEGEPKFPKQKTHMTADKRAAFLAVTFPEPGKIILCIGPGDHTFERWEITMEQLRLVMLDVMPKVLFPLK